MIDIDQIFPDSLNDNTYVQYLLRTTTHGQGGNIAKRIPKQIKLNVSAVRDGVDYSKSIGGDLVLHQSN